MPTETADITLGFTPGDMRRLREAATGCRLDVAEFIRLTVQNAVRGIEETRARA